MKGRLRIILLALAAAFVLAIITMMAFIYGSTTPFPPLPNPNGYDDFVKAGTLLSGRIGDFRDLNQPELKELIVTNASALTLIRVGLQKKCALPLEDYVTNFANALPNLAAQKQIVQLLTAEGRLAELEGRPEGAARSYLDAVRFGNEISRNGFVINRLVGVACSGIGSSSLARLAPQLGCEQSKPIITELGELDRASVTWKEVQRAEGIFMRHELRRIPNPIAWIPMWRQARQANRAAEVRHNRGLSHMRLLETDLALRCYLAERGAPPTQLAQLVPQYFQRVPHDPFSTGSLTYRLQGTNWLLYSVGPDGKDDGGIPAGRGTSGKGDLLLDSQW